MPWPTDPSEPYFGRGLWGWFEGLWRKQGLIWAYADQYSERELANNVAAGTVYFNFSVVPAGEVWVVTAFSCYGSQGNATAIFLGKAGQGINHWYKAKAAPAAFDSTDLVGSIILKETDHLRVVIAGAALNDDFESSAVGYKMAVS